MSCVQADLMSFSKHKECGGRRVGLRQRGQLVAHLSATIEAGADLRTIASAADQVAADLARVL